MTLVNAGISVLISGIVGWLSSVYAAGPVARRQRRAGASWDAQRAIEALARDYIRALIRGRPDRQGPGRGSFAAGYASLRGQAEFAEAVLPHMRDLAPRSRRSTRRTMVALVGEKALATEYAGVEPPGFRATNGNDSVSTEELYDEADHYDQVEREILRGYHDGTGCKRENQVQCERDHYPQVRDEYGELGLLWLMSQNDHFQGFHAQFAVAVECLESLLPVERGAWWSVPGRWISRCSRRPLERLRERTPGR